MGTSLSEALAPVAARLPREVREHEVLRVAGSLPGQPEREIADAAVSGVLTWAQEQAGTRLPEQAWLGESFDLPLPGRDPTVVRLRTGSADLWAFRMHRPDRDVPGRAWTTEVVLGRLPQGQVRFSLRLLVATEEADLPIVPAVPGFLRKLVEDCGMVAGSQPVMPSPMAVRTAGEADDLFAHLIHRDRQLPTFVLSCPAEASPPALDAFRLNRHVLGLAHVAVIDPDAAWRLTDRFGKRLSVFGGAVRVYRPGFDESADPYAHPLVLAGALSTADGAKRTETWLRGFAARESLRRTRLGDDVLTFASIRSAQRAQRAAAPPDTASAADQPALAERQRAALQDELAALQAEVAELKSANRQQLDAWLAECERAEAAEAQARASAARIQELIAQLVARGDDPDAGAAGTLPARWSDFLAWCDATLAGRVVLTGSARRGVKKALYASVETAARCLLWLATAARERFAAGGGTLKGEPILEGIRNEPCGADSFEFDWDGRRLAADWHVKNGGNTRTPEHCLRIYYGYDPQTRQIIVADMPAHRRTGAT